MTTQDCTDPEMLSALFDGHAGSEKVLERLPVQSRGDVYGNWSCYQLIGDVMRSPSSTANVGADPAFVHRLSARLSQEVMEKPVALAITVQVPPAQAANDQQFRWKLVAGFASLGAVAVLAWNITIPFLGASAPQLVQSTVAPSVLVTATPEGPMIRDPRLEDLLSAHKQMGGTSLQVPSGFVRNAGFDAPRQSGR